MFPLLLEGLGAPQPFTQGQVERRRQTQYRVSHQDGLGAVYAGLGDDEGPAAASHVQDHL